MKTKTYRPHVKKTQPISATLASRHMEMQARVEITRIRCSYSYKALWVFGWLGIFWIFKEAVVATIAHTPEQINAISRVIESLAKLIQAKIIFPWGLFALSLIVIYIQNHRIKRYIHKLDECRRELEATDPDRTSSGLTKDGATPPSR